ncbi:MAG: CapA family protein [Thermomicrobiales bacterium]
MDRPPDHPTPPTRRPHLPDLPDTRGSAAGGGGTSGNLPPWSSFGLDPEPDPAFDADWNPLGGAWDDAALPARPRPHVRRRAIFLVALAGVILIAIGSVAFLALTGDDDDDDPTDAALGAPTGAATAAAGAGVAVSPTSTRPPLTDGQPTLNPTAPPTATVPAPTATPSGPLLVAVVDATVGGIAAADLAARIERALANAVPDRTVRIVGADEAVDAAIVLAGASPGEGYESRMVASEPLAAITSPRLPLFGVGGAQIDRLLRGEITSWRDAGAAVDLPVVTLALSDNVPAGSAPVATYDDYEALVAGLDEHRGGIALVPVSQVDFRVNVLAIDGVDPLRGRASSDYPYFLRLYLGVRQEDVASLRPAVDAALGALGQVAATPAAGGMTTVGFVGDIVPGRNVAAKIAESGDPAGPFRDVAAQLGAYDLTVANLEGVLSETIEAPDDPHTFTFVADPSLLDGLDLAGIDGVSLANNHTMNAGVEGLQDTMDALDEAGIRYAGAGNTLDEAREPAIFQVNGLTIAILGINGVTANPNDLPGVVSGDEAATADSPGTNPFVVDQFLADIRAATERADIVIPYFHMGVEYRDLPPEWAEEAARAAIDAGAAMVVANHPHVIQGMEIYEGRPILYSLGNFVFDQMFSIEVRTGLILEVTFRGKEIAGLRLHGVEIEDFHRPRPMTSGEQAALLDRFWRLTDALAARIEV